MSIHHPKRTRTYLTGDRLHPRPSGRRAAPGWRSLERLPCHLRHPTPFTRTRFLHLPPPSLSAPAGLTPAFMAFMRAMVALMPLPVPPRVEDSSALRLCCSSWLTCVCAAVSACSHAQTKCLQRPQMHTRNHAHGSVQETQTQTQAHSRAPRGQRLDLGGRFGGAILHARVVDAQAASSFWPRVWPVPPSPSASYASRPR